MLLSAISNFRNETIDRSDHASNLAKISLVLGALYSAVVAMEVFGIFAAVTQRAALVRIYAFISVFGALIVIGAAFLRTIIHFVLKNDIITECTNLSTNETVVFTFGIWGPTTSGTLDAQDAADWCNSAWSHDSFSEIVGLIVTIVLSAFFCSLAFAYYRQVLDPSSPANLSRAPASGRGANAYPAHYAPAYNYTAPAPNLAYMPESRREEEYGYDEQFAPPYEAGKLPGYGVGDGKFAADMDAKKADDRFSDFDGNSMYGKRGLDDDVVERDVTSRPGPGGRETFT
jgi:hypothetical protein